MEEFDACVQMFTRLIDFHSYAIMILFDKQFGGVEKVSWCCHCMGV